MSPRIDLERRYFDPDTKRPKREMTTLGSWPDESGTYTTRLGDRIDITVLEEGKAVELTYRRFHSVKLPNGDHASEKQKVKIKQSTQYGRAEYAPRHYVHVLMEGGKMPSVLNLERDMSRRGGRR